MNRAHLVTVYINYREKQLNKRQKSYLQSWTEVLTRLSKPSAFYRRPSVIEKKILSIVKSPIPFFNVEIRFVDTVTWLKH